MSRPAGGGVHDAGAGAPADDAVAGAVLAALALAALVWLVPGFTEAVTGEYDIAPTVFPRLAATLVLGFSLALALSGVARLRGAAPGARSRGPGPVVELAAWSAAAALAVAGIATAGFVPTAAALIAAGMILAGRRGWRLVAGAAIGFPLLLDAAAWWVFTVDLP